ncbi:tyrosine-protein phosphatase non-receptor type 23-like isoform X2 [Battus philenor]|uniref:tyrosine-protein phosphatase non-receptor type 23-like isoform X2 n=1 Tax=Battus philenor TaxID=42288 RepID=UPI0035CEE114
MEAVPKLPMISFELKVSPENTHFGPKLKQYIAEAYREDPDSYGNEIHQLEGLRSAAVRATVDAAGLSSLNRYFCQLRAMQSRFPMAKGQPVACTFAWKDLYANMSCSLADIRFEMASILYNIGALHTQLGAAEPRTTPDSLKAACSHYQQAAWAFNHLKEQYPQPPGADVSTEILSLLQEICFAQAQECILDKSIQDTRKPSVIGAVATQVMLFYKNSLVHLGPSTGTDNIHEIIGTKLYNQWYRYLVFKACYIGCIVCLYQGMNAEEQQKMGERVAYYQQAVDKLAEARKLAKYIEPVQVTQEALTFTNDVVEGKRKAAKNENEFIYHEEVPEKDLLMDLKPVCLVKTLPINFNDPEISGPDIFSRLVPMGAHEAASMYSEEKAKLLRQVVTQAEVKNTELTEFMSSLQLDQLEVLDSDQKVPQEIVDRCAAMNAKTEIIQSLVESMNNLAEVISDVEHSLTEIKSLIQEETLKEKEYQKMMGPRPPSIVQTEISREFHKYQEAHTRTNESNQVLHKAMTLHIANLKLLSQPLDILQSKIPSIDNIEGLDRDTMKEMRRVVGKAREMQTQRDSLIQELREAINGDDITAKLLARSGEPVDEIFQQEIEKHAPKVKIIEQNLAAQENIINKLTSLYAAYGESRRLLSDVLRKREGLINALVTSYDAYEELLGKSQKGLEFYKKLSHNVNQLLTRLRSTCQVQEEERSQMLSKQSSKAPAVSAASSSAMSKTLDAIPTPPSTSSTPKLKDYLPYMKNRSLARNIIPQAQVDPLPADTYYPDSIYPTSVRPAPVGSEDVTQMSLPDGVVMPSPMHNVPNPYGRYGAPYAPSEMDSYASQHTYAYSVASKANFDKAGSEDMSNYDYTSYTPSQFANQMADPQTYTNPYYSATHNNTTIVTDSQSSVQYNNAGQANLNPNMQQHNVYNDPYTHVSQPGPIPESISMYSSMNQTELNASMANMQISGPKADPNFATEYSQTYYSMQYQHMPTANMATYSNATQDSQTSIVSSQLPSDYSLNYSYTGDMGNQFINQQPVQQNTPNTYSTQYQYTGSQDQTAQNYVYTNADSTVTTTTSVANASVSIPNPYGTPGEINQEYTSSFPQLDAIDKPIKSHVTGEALSSLQPSYQSYTTSFNAPADQNYQPTGTNYQDQTINYAHNYQNHPGYTYNSSSGSYDYNYGSQNSYSNYGVAEQANMDPQMMAKDPNWNPQTVYTNAGVYNTVNSPSEVPQMQQQVSMEQPVGDQAYYNHPYGYHNVQTVNTDQQVLVPQQNVPEQTNYSAEMNQSTYMQSAQGPGTSVTYTNNQVSSPKENEVSNDQSKETSYQTTPIEEPETRTVPEVPKEEKIKVKTEPSTFDLLSEIDFNVEYKPLTPEIKVPQVSSKVVMKPSVVVKPEPTVTRQPSKEEMIERPAKQDIFSDPSLLNSFTQEVKLLQNMTDSLTNNTSGGAMVLESKWKMLQDVQMKENMSRTKTVAMQHTEGNIASVVVPFDDSRVTLKSDHDAYINASYYKQLAPWCIPLMISKCPTDSEYGTFWKAIIEYKISCIVCLQTEIEMQGTSYWPTAKGQSLDLPGVKVSLDDVTCTVHFTERKLTVSSGKTAISVSHYQINVFPTKIVCAPLVLLCERVLAVTYSGRLSNQLRGACVQCGEGAGRSAFLALLLVAMCQVRAGDVRLCDMLESACVNLYKHRSNVLENPKYMADAYRTVLFYAQGVLCSGTTLFNGEAVSLQSGAAVFPRGPATAPPPPATPPATATTATSNTSATRIQKFSRESFEEMRQSPGLKSGDMKDPLNFLDPLWSLKKK